MERTELEDNSVMLSLVGGKWTTFRALAETLGGKVLAELGVPEVQSTRGVAIGGGKNYPRSAQEKNAWLDARSDRAPRARLEVLLERYGSRADTVLEAIGANDPVLAECAELSAAELVYLAEHEQIGTLVDLFIRRTSLAFRGLVTPELMGTCAGILAPVPGLGLRRNRRAGHRVHPGPGAGTRGAFRPRRRLNRHDPRFTSPFSFRLPLYPRFQTWVKCAQKRL